MKSNKLTNSQNKLTNFENKLKDLNLNIIVGDSIYHNGEICKIEKIDKNGLHYRGYRDYNDEEGWTNYGKKIISWCDIENYYEDYIKMEMPYEEYHKEALEFFSNPKEYEIKQKLLTSNSAETNTTALIIPGNDINLLDNQSKIKIMSDKMKILTSILENKRNQLKELRNDFIKKLQQINKVITVLEIYMGIDEEIIQIKEGNNALNNIPLCFRQKLLFMDEEMAEYMINGGADIRNIEDFQEWLLTNDNYKLIVPEEKCVVAMRSRRNEKKYGSLFEDMQYNNAGANFKTFVLIRNGENLYRIWTNKFNIYKRLFPKIDQFDKIEVEEEIFGQKRIEKKFKEGYWNEDEAENDKENFKFNVLMMQGLIDRTEIFKPMNDKVNLFDPKTYGESVKLILDDEFVIHTGRPSFREYVKELNKGIKRGSRVYVSLQKNKKDYCGRFKIDYVNEYHTPDKPSDGIYTIIEVPKQYQWDGFKGTKEEVKEKYKYYNGKGLDDMHIISYNPGGIIINYWDYYDSGHERKNKVKFCLDLDYDRVFNYDVLDLADIEYYLADRVERHDYLYMFDILKNLKSIRKEELKWEKSFVRLVKDRNQCSEKLVWDCVEWWKLKNIWKRPITQDDSKALRMIEKRIKKIKNDKDNK